MEGLTLKNGFGLLTPCGEMGSDTVSFKLSKFLLDLGEFDEMLESLNLLQAAPKWAVDKESWNDGSVEVE